MHEPRIDADEAKEQSWDAEASLMKSSESVEEFILKYGGKMHVGPITPGLSVSPEDDMFVLGGCEADPKMSTILSLQTLT